jgi:hypothetical protein
VIKAAVICAVWTFTFLLLLAVGGLLSWAGPRVCGRVPSPPTGPAQGRRAQGGISGAKDGGLGHVRCGVSKRKEPAWSHLPLSPFYPLS